MTRCCGFSQAVTEAHGGEFHEIETGGGARKQEKEIERWRLEDAERFIDDDESIAHKELLP